MFGVAEEEDESDIFPAGSLLDGRYEIVRRLGAGGMGVVYEARHVRLGQSVAIKAIRGDVPLTGAELTRFEREARAAAQLKSRHSVRVFDIDTAPNGITYIAMELLAGAELSAELRRGPTTGEIVDWVVQVCDALQEAHDLGIVHRDIKPENVFIAREGERRVAKLLDFGISKVLSESPAGTTVNSSVMGTPEYMSPEQIRARRVDHRTDIFSIGVVLYRALAGRLPFAAENGFPYITAVVVDPPTPLESLRPDLPPALVQVVMTAIEKSPDDRYPSARDLAKALEPFGGGELPLPSRLSAEVGLADARTLRDPSVAPAAAEETAPHGLGRVNTQPLALAAVTPPRASAGPASLAPRVDRPSGVTSVAAPAAPARSGQGRLVAVVAFAFAAAFSLGFGVFLVVKRPAEARGGVAPSAPPSAEGPPAIATAAPTEVATTAPPASDRTATPPATGTAEAPTPPASAARVGARPAPSASSRKPAPSAGTTAAVKPAPTPTDDTPPFLPP